MTAKLYGFWRSIASFRVRVALRLKSIPFEEVSIDILSGEQFNSDYDRVNTEHVVPTFVHDGHSVFQSLSIMEYLDDIQPDPALLPKDKHERADARALALVAIADSHPLIVPRVRKHLAEAFGADPETVNEWGKHWSSKGLATYERLLSRRRPAPFALGLTPTIADICIAGQIVMGTYFKVDMNSFPIVEELGRHCFAMPEFSSSHPSRQSGATPH